MTSYILSGLFVVRAVAVDEVNGFMYWSDGALIKQSTLDGTYIKDVVRAGKCNIIIIINIIKLYFSNIYTGNDKGPDNT